MSGEGDKSFREKKDVRLFCLDCALGNGRQVAVLSSKEWRVSRSKFYKALVVIRARGPAVPDLDRGGCRGLGTLVVMK